MCEASERERRRRATITRLNGSQRSLSLRASCQNLDLPIPQSLRPPQLNSVPRINWNDPPAIFTHREVSYAPAHTCNHPPTPGGSCDCFGWTSTGAGKASFTLCFSFLGSKSSGGGFELWVRDWNDFESTADWVPKYSQEALQAQGRSTLPKVGLDWLKSRTARSSWIWEYIRNISGLVDQVHFKNGGSQPNEHEPGHGWAPWKLDTFWAARMISNRSHMTRTYLDSMHILGVAAEVYQDFLTPQYRQRYSGSRW